jgi:hypothetical protein
MSTTYPIFKEVGEEAFKLVLNRNGNEVTYFFSYPLSICQTHIPYNHTDVFMPQPAPDASGITLWIPSVKNGPITLTPEEGAILSKQIHR